MNNIPLSFYDITMLIVPCGIVKIILFKFLYFKIKTNIFIYNNILYINLYFIINITRLFINLLNIYYQIVKIVKK